MTSVDVRLDRVEDRLTEVVELLNGGPNVSWDRSVRGRLHFLLTQDAARVQRDTLRADASTRRWSRGEILAAVVIGSVQAALTLATLLVAMHG
jgi:hypothetical protein